ncbi:MAG: glycosyltransferase family 2 protein [Verrucomicrobiota bacterium]
MPSYSILLPTRNGAELLPGVLASVLDQDYEDFELVVSDNASDDETPEVLADLAGRDPRVVLLRQEQPLGVTENWMQAFRACSGDRFTLIGDDDLLLPGYFRKADRLVDAAGDPDVLMYNGYAFAFPGFLGVAGAQYTDPFFTFEPPIPRDGWFDEGARRFTIEAIFRFDFPVPLNFQNVLAKRTAASLLPGDFFRQPFPDFFALVGLMLRAGTWYISHEQMVVIGVSPKSFGQTAHSSQSAEKARSYLGIDPSFEGQLPGSEVMNGHYETLQVLQGAFPDELGGMVISRSEYVWQQAYSWYVQYRLGSLDLRGLLGRVRLLSASDLGGLAHLFGARLRPGVLGKRARMAPGKASEALWPGMRPAPGIDDISGFGRWISGA